MKKGWGRLLMIVVVIAVVGVLFYRPANGEFCDGSYPAWQAEEFRDGCGRPAALYEYLLPWHWGAPTLCSGMCGPTNLRPS